MTSTPQRLLQTIFRKTIIWLFIIVGMLYIVYSSHLLLSKDRQCLTHDDNLAFFNNITKSIHINEQQHLRDSLDPILLPQKSQTYSTDLSHIVFGIAASANLWEKRKEYVKIWWRPKETRGVVWIDKGVRIRKSEGLPEIRVSANTSSFKYTNRQGDRSAIRISRVISETLRL